VKIDALARNIAIKARLALPLNFEQNFGQKKSPETEDFFISFDSAY